MANLAPLREIGCYQFMPDRHITVMYLIDTFISPSGSPFKGGAEKQLYLLASELNPALFHPIIVQLSPDRSSAVPTGRADGLEIFHFPLRKIYSGSGLQQIASLVRLAKRKNVDIIHTVFEKAEVIGWLIKGLAGTPAWVVSRRDLGFKRKKIYDRIFAISARNCSRCIANCQAVKDQVVKEGSLTPEKIEIIFNGIDFPAAEDHRGDRSLRSELGIVNGAPMVGMIANFNFEIKGHRYFLEAAGKVLGHRPDVKFVLVGDGPLRPDYERMGRSLGIEKSIFFLGKRSDTPSIIAGLDISVLCSTSEGFSNVILESMAAGKPVAATNVGGNKEMVTDGETGVLVPPADSAALADGILELIRNPEKARSMGNRGRTIVRERFSIEEMVTRYESLYLSLL